jgi:hypothetical protein
MGFTILSENAAHLYGIVGAANFGWNHVEGGSSSRAGVWHGSTKGLSRWKRDASVLRAPPTVTSSISYLGCGHHR